MTEDRMLSDEILLALIKKNSGGGGTTNYNNLDNLPQIGGVTLQGNKTASDLGLASEEDLEEKQDVLLYGGVNPSSGEDGDMYVKLIRDESTLIDMFGSPSAESTDDYEMSYTVDSSVMGDYYDYEAFGAGKGFGQNGRGSMTITYHFKNSKFKPANVSYCNNFNLSGGGYLESANFAIKASNDGTNWDILYSTTYLCPRDTSVSADIATNTYYSYFKFEMNSDGGYTGIRNIVMNGISESYSNIDNIYFKKYGVWLKDAFAKKSELDAKQDTLTFDDVPTANSNNPVKSNGIYDALALKQNATDNSLDTEAKTIVGAINEHEGDIGSLKSGLTNVANQIVGIKADYLSSSSGDTVYIPAKVYPRVLIVLNNQGSDGTNGRPAIVGVLSMGQSGAYKFEQITNITDYALTFTYDNTTDPNNPRYAVQYIKVSDSTPQTYLRGFYITADLRWTS